MTEEWRTCAEFPDYEVSDLGNVRRRTPSVVYKWPAGYVLKPRSNAGYLAVRLARRGGNRLVHVLVARAFLGDPPTPKLEVNHKDGDKHNNRVGNLEWVTHRENMIHATRAGLNVTPTTPVRMARAALIGCAAA